MGASESTTRSNATKNEEEDKSQQQNNNSGGSFIGAATVVAAAVAGIGVAAYGVSKMISDDTDNQQRVQNEVVQCNSPNLGGSSSRSKWSPPPAGRYKMNTDGGCHPDGNVFFKDSVKRGPSGYGKMNNDGGCHPNGNVFFEDSVKRGRSGYGGILRDHHGQWVRGFIGYIHESDSLTSEFHGILKGLEVLDNLKLKEAILETDSQSAYQWVTRQDDRRGKSKIVDACWLIITKCRKLAKKNAVTFSLVREDANRCADKLANMAIDREQPHVEITDFEDVPYELRLLVNKDANMIN